MRSDATCGFHLWIVGGGDCHGFIEITHLFKDPTQSSVDESHGVFAMLLIGLTHFILVTAQAKHFGNPVAAFEKQLLCDIKCATRRGCAVHIYVERPCNCICFISRHTSI